MRLKNITGLKCGKLVVLDGCLPNRKILVKCECGKEKIISRYDVLNKQIKSCGAGVCRDTGRNLKDYVFCFLTVLERASEDEEKLLKTRSKQWKCQCICSNVIIVPANQLFSGKTKSCGCKKNEITIQTKSISLKEKLENIFYNSYKSRSMRSRMIFALEKQDFINLIYGNCFYCASSPSLYFSRKIKNCIEGIIVNGIDRINNNIGYDTSNSVTCCKICNYAKNTLSIEEFIDWLQKITNNLQKLRNTIL